MSQIKDPFSITQSTNIDTAHHTLNNWLDESGSNNPEKFLKLNPKYAHMYGKFLKNKEELQSIVNISKQQIQQESIKSFISKSLSVKNNKESFEEKFSSQFKMNKKKPIMTMINALNTITQKIGETEEVKRQNQKNMFFSQNKKVLKLQEDCLLLEYYYKDRSQFVPKSTKGKNNLPIPNISYLHSCNNSEIKHKRIEKNPKEYEKMYLAHHEGYFEKRKMINYVKDDKFKSDSYHRAKLNYQFKRQKNFAQMAEITKQNRDNLLIENQKKIPKSQIKQKQNKFSRIMKLFLHFAYIEQTKRAYYDYIEMEGMQKLKDFIIENQFSYKLTQKVITEMFQKIIEFKSQKKLEFFDFVEFLDTVQQQFSLNLMDLTEQKHPSFFVRPQQTYLHENWQQIKKEMNSKKIKFTLKLIFQSVGNLLFLGQFLPVKQIPRMISNLGITGNDIPRTKLFEILYWNLRRPEGLNFNEFYFAFLMLGVKDNNYENVFKLMSKIKIKEILE